MLIFLTGFMCSGKTTYGKALTEKLNVPFWDLDMELESQSELSIWEFIEQKGITEFRRLESEILLQCHHLLPRHIFEAQAQNPRPEAVIATGGGSVLIPENRDFLLQPGHSTVWLDLPFPLLLERIRKDKRPILQGLDDAQIYRVWQERLPYYQSTCTHRISTLPVLEQILSFFLLPA
jgi:shikimate kinase